MDALDGLKIMTFADSAEWEAWLAGHHDFPDGIWLKIAKKGSGLASVTIGEALDVALCYGWIDGQRRRYDAAYYLQKYTRRRSRSEWSMVNVRKVDALTAAGRMREPGLAEVAAARADGRWAAAYESQKNATVPDDLAAALKGNEQAAEFFERLGRTDQYLAIVRLLRARTPEVRAARLEKVIAELAAGRKVR
ncbi:YdeI/OmpD-associated family protein [Streptomyces apocyni]|uniref:YdeI/OmpD-associated family protein n=1 Tax=Streptomyces apocyni TaxID=2654677 RepID=UPI0012EA33A4|nr:YdeI/OmpD-associated family protein [Streptomyces apocyni]